MASDPIHVIDPSASVYLKLWLFALAGLVVPSAITYFWPDLSWVGKAERAHELSLTEKVWKDPWLPIDQTQFSSGWVRCAPVISAFSNSSMPSETTADAAVMRDFALGFLLIGTLRSYAANAVSCWRISSPGSCAKGFSLRNRTNRDGW